MPLAASSGAAGRERAEGRGRGGGAAPAPDPDAANHYQLLGVPYGATGAEIGHAYRAAMKRIHPDRQRAVAAPLGREAAEEEARRLNRAYATLSKPSERQAYDRTIRNEIVQDRIMSRYVAGFPAAGGDGGGSGGSGPAAVRRRAPTAAERRERQRADRDAFVSLVAVFGGLALVLILLLLLWGVIEAVLGAVL